MAKKENAEDIINRYKDIALSDNEVLALVNGRANLILYPELIHYDNIDDVLGEHEACILLFEAKPSYGHWVCLFKTSPDEIEFFNSYGGFPDDSLRFIPLHYREESNQLKPILSELLMNSPYKLFYNEHVFQKHGKNIRTCGRWICLRLLCRTMPLKEFAKLFKNKNADEIATILTMHVNK